MMRRALVLLLVVSGCATSSTIIDRSSLEVSANSRVVSRNIIPNAARYPNVVEHLALAQEVYQKQMLLLKDRRASLRSRIRLLDATSYGAFAATTLGVGVAAIASRDGAAQRNLETAGYAALGGLAVGTLLKVFGYMQEDPAAVDSKIRQLQSSYDALVERIRTLGERGELEEQSTESLGAQMAAAIEMFIAQAIQIEVKG